MNIKVSLCHAALAVSAVCFLNACNVLDRNRVTGSGNVKKEERTIGTFSRLKVYGSMNVFLTQGAEKPAVIEAEDNIAPLVELVNEGDRLKIRYKQDVSVQTHRSVNVYLTTPNVEEVSLAGSGDITMDKFNVKEPFKAALSGSGNLRGSINAPAVNAAISGSGNMRVQGETRDVDLSIAGSGDFSGDELLAENVKVSIAGSGNALVHASVKLNARIAGSGDIKYKGNPEVSSSIAGSGSVRKK